MRTGPQLYCFDLTVVVATTMGEGTWPAALSTVEVCIAAVELQRSAPFK